MLGKKGVEEVDVCTRMACEQCVTLRNGKIVIQIQYDEEEPKAQSIPRGRNRSKGIIRPGEAACAMVCEMADRSDDCPQVRRSIGQGGCRSDRVGEQGSNHDGPPHQDDESVASWALPPTLQ